MGLETTSLMLGFDELMGSEPRLHASGTSDASFTRSNGRSLSVSRFARACAANSRAPPPPPFPPTMSSTNQFRVSPFGVSFLDTEVWMERGASRGADQLGSHLCLSGTLAARL